MLIDFWMGIILVLLELYEKLWGIFTMGKNYHLPILKINHMDKCT